MRTLLVALALSVSAAAASAQPFAAVDSLVRAFAAENELPSLVVGVSVGGERHVVGVGEANGRAVDSGTLYEIGSITKGVTALALADAVVRGEVTLETPVADLLPGTDALGQEGEPVRLWHLATHTSGLPRLPMDLFYAPGFDMADPYAVYDEDALYTSLATLSPTPGETASYSNLGAGLLGFALAQRAGSPYEALVTERVLAPLGLLETSVDVPEAQTPWLAEGYGPDGEPAPGWTFQEPTVAFGGLRASTADMLTLGEALARPDDTPLAEAIALALEPRADVGNGWQIGLGWFLMPAPGAPDLTMAWHNGGTGGFRSFLAAVPEADVVVVALTNRATDAGVDTLAPQVAQLLLESR